MSDLVSVDEIEQIVGHKRHDVQHIARAVSAEQTVYILHSQECKDSGVDLRQCPYSLALDNGIVESDWRDCQDEPVVVAIYRQQLMPLKVSWLEPLDSPGGGS